MVDVDSGSLFRRSHSLCRHMSSGLVLGRRPLIGVRHASNEPGMSCRNGSRAALRLCSWYGKTSDRGAAGAEASAEGTRMEVPQANVNVPGG